MNPEGRPKMRRRRVLAILNPHLNLHLLVMRQKLTPIISM
jgi:hypothetical protein